MQAQDVPFPRQKVVSDVHPGHRSKMAADDVIGDEAGHFSGGVAALLDLMECGGPDLQPLLVRLIPLGDASVQVPAVVVEPRRSGDLPHIVQRLVLEFAKADGDVRNLDAGIVDVVLDLDVAPQKPHQPAERVAECGVAQVTDVRRLVRIDCGVLDDRFAAS